MTCRHPITGDRSSEFLIVTETEYPAKPKANSAWTVLRGLLVGAGYSVKDLAWMPARCEGPGLEPCPRALNALEDAPARYVMLLGTASLHLLRPDLSIKRARGAPFQVGPRLFMAGCHQETIFRNPSWEPLLEQDLARMAKVVQAEAWVPVAPVACVACGADENAMERLVIDDQGIHYCERCG